jgi:hypothetical protein
MELLDGAIVDASFAAGFAKVLVTALEALEVAADNRERNGPLFSSAAAGFAAVLDTPDGFELVDDASVGLRSAIVETAGFAASDGLEAPAVVDILFDSPLAAFFSSPVSWSEVTEVLDEVVRRRAVEAAAVERIGGFDKLLVAVGRVVEAAGFVPEPDAGVLDLAAAEAGTLLFGAAEPVRSELRFAAGAADAVFVDLGDVDDVGFVFGVVSATGSGAGSAAASAAGSATGLMTGSSAIEVGGGSEGMTSAIVLRVENMQS